MPSAPAEVVRTLAHRESLRALLGVPGPLDRRASVGPDSSTLRHAGARPQTNGPFVDGRQATRSAYRPTPLPAPPLCLIVVACVIVNRFGELENLELVSIADVLLKRGGYRL